MSVLPRTGRAAILASLKQPLVIDEIELPQTLGPGQVFVEIFYSGICGAQLNEIEGVKGDDPYVPHLLGHEGSGRVIAVGPGVREVKPSDIVVLHWRKGHGIESDPAKYQWRGKALNSGWVTTFNQYAVVSENRVTPIPSDFDLEIAPLFGCAVTTALGVLDNDARLKIGESVVVLGSGGVGLNIVQGAALRAAHPVVAVDLHEGRLELARRLGATHTIHAGKGDVGAELRRIFGKAGADVIVECTGNVSLIELAYEMTGPRGRAILVGVPRKEHDITIHSLPLHFGKLLTGSHGGGTDPSTDIPRYLRLCQAGKLPLHSLITHRFRLAEINEAIRMLRAGEIGGRCIIQLADGVPTRAAS